MILLIFIASVFLMLFLLAYVESPTYARNRQIRQLVKKSKQSERLREWKPRSGSKYVQAGWSQF